ncbi:antiviral innate immune response receptor RIG-I [Aplochiton taeniatus]
MSELQKTRLRKYAKYVSDILRPSHIKFFMTDYLDKECVETILSEENTSEALTHWDFGTLESTREHRLLLDKIRPAFIQGISAKDLIPHLSDCLKDMECEEIRMKEQVGPMAAAELLTDCLIRSDCSTWFKQLKSALYEREFFPALELLDPSDASSKQSEEEMAGSEVGDKLDVTMSTMYIQYTQDSDEDDGKGLLKSTNHINLDEAPPTTASEPVGGASLKPLGEKRLRGYQEELAQPVHQGRNTIVCAPTGSGKTVVALAICEQHLKSRGQGSVARKVVFMATKVDVYNQQLSLFQSHFSLKDPSVRIQGLCGDQADLLSLDFVVENNDIIVLTPQILVNALVKGEVPSLSLFSLIILDECHNTTGKHPYNMIMTRYHDAKLTHTPGPLPQIVGLTASVGIGSFKNQSEAEDNISQLCASLDTSVISTVKDNIEELRKYVHTPEKDFSLVETRKQDPFIRIVHDIMERIEGLAKAVYNIESLSTIQNRDYGSQKYEQWIVDVQKKCLVLQFQDPEEESRVCRALYNYTEHLRRYNDALIINEDARTKDALDFLSHFIEQVKSRGHDHTERQLTQCFDAQQMHLRSLASGGQSGNPKLEALEWILQEKYREDPDTRTVLFVRTRALADALKRWMEESDDLKFLKPGVLIGRGRRSQLTSTGHMTLNTKKDVLKSFKSSTNQSKILIATSVADEGIDIPQCNLVLMYEYVGNVVKMVQVRGRGRAEGSVCILVSNQKERIDKEKMNIQKEKIVETAIFNLQNKPDILTAKEDKVRRDQEKMVPERSKVEATFQLLCMKCKAPACSSDDLRVLQNSHHVVLDPSFYCRARTQTHPKPRNFDGLVKTRKLFCGKCSMDWGIVATFNNIQDLPLIKIESFVAEDLSRKPKRVLRYFRKWKEVPFLIKPFEITEILSVNWEPLGDED